MRLIDPRLPPLGSSSKRIPDLTPSREEKIKMRNSVKFQELNSGLLRKDNIALSPIKSKSTPEKANSPVKKADPTFTCNKLGF